MPAINITGRPAGPQPAPGLQPSLLKTPAASSQVPYLRPELSAAFQANQRNMQSAGDDYAKALRQRAQQERSTIQSEQRLQREQQSAWREHERRQREVDRRVEKQSREEMRMQASQSRSTQSRGNRFDRLGFQASDTLTPAKFRGLLRQIQIFKREFPDHAAEAMALESGAGSPEGAIRTAHAMRLGHAGQRAASLRDRRSLKLAERDLQQMEKDALQAMKGSAEGSPERADAQRLHRAVGEARKRIQVGRSLPASPSIRKGIGHHAASAIAGLGGTLGSKGAELTAAGIATLDPVMAAAGAAMVAEATPFINAGVQSMLQSVSRPYLDLRRATAQAGRTSGFSSRELEAQIFQGANPSSWMRALGLGPQDAANLLNRSGVITRSPGEAAGVIRQVGGASLQAGMGLSMEQTGGYARNLATLGLVRPGSAPFDLQQEYDRLGKLMAQSTAAGLDHSSTLATMEGLLRAGAAAGAPSINAGGIESLFSRMLASGAPSARTGQSEMSFLSGYNASVGSLGPGNLPATLMVSAAMRGKPPGDDKGLARFLGVSDSDFQQLKSQPNAGRLIDDYLQAQRRGDPNAYRFLGVLMQDHPELAESITNKALPNTPQYLRDIAGSNTFGTGLSNYTQNAAGAGNVPLGIRNNNPLVLAAANQPGLVGSQTARDGERAGQFSTMEAGIAAGYHQILIDQQKTGGTGSIRQLLDQWSPNGQYNAQHAATIAKNLGISPDQQLNLASDPAMSARLMRQMSIVENGGDMVAKGMFKRGINLARGKTDDNGNSQSGANEMAANVGAAQTLASEGAYTNFAGTAGIKGLESALGSVSNTVVTWTGKLETAFDHAAEAIERGAQRLGHAFGGVLAGPRVAPNGQLHVPSDPLGTSMMYGVLK